MARRATQRPPSARSKPPEMPFYSLSNWTCFRGRVNHALYETAVRHAESHPPSGQAALRLRGGGRFRQNPARSHPCAGWRLGRQYRHRSEMGGNRQERINATVERGALVALKQDRSAPRRSWTQRPLLPMRSLTARRPKTSAPTCSRWPWTARTTLGNCNSSVARRNWRAIAAPSCSAKPGPKFPQPDVVAPEYPSAFGNEINRARPSPAKPMPRATLDGLPDSLCALVFLANEARALAKCPVRASAPKHSAWRSCTGLA